MAKNSFFYNTQDIKDLKELIRTGEPISRIAEREYQRFGAPSAQALQVKMYKLAESTTKVREWNGPKRIRTAKPVARKSKGVVVPQGTTFEGTPKKVEIFSDHFRIYF